MTNYIWGVPLLLLAIYWAMFYLFQRRWLFPVHRIKYASDSRPRKGEVAWLEHDGGQSELWWLPAFNCSEKRPVVIVAHGQMGLIDSWEARLNGLRKRGFHCLLVEFPGYGRSAGTPSEKTITSAFCAAYDWVIARDDVRSNQVVGLGRSMGGGAICCLAEKRALSCLWLMSTFTSLKSFVHKKWVPAGLLRNVFDNLGVVSELKIPVFILHGTEDSVIPVGHGKKLAKATVNTELLLEKADHDNCPLDWEAYWQRAESFFRKNVDG